MKRKKRRLKLGHIFFYLILLYIGIILWNQKKLAKELTIKRDKVFSETEALKADIDKLEEEIQISDSLKFVEKIAREELGMVKPREIIYIDKNKKKNPFFTLRKSRTN
ncbi:MAG: septum formation initiator family protein [Tissierellaceae bacterium]|nr:septum formation initiator family protein [Tissierellaceae bacterium]